MRKQADPILVLFFVSGFSGLIYESVWSHYLKIFVGHAAYAQTLVLVVFIGGLALGSGIFGRIAERVRNPLRVYALAEGAIGVIALLFHGIFVRATEWGYEWLLPSTCDAASTFCFGQWALAALLLAPQSILLGTTFPLVCSAVLRIENEAPGEEVAALYFLNSLGAVLGVLASAFVLIPSVGLPGTLMTAGSINILIALIAWLLSKNVPPPLAIAPIAAAPDDAIGAKLLKLLLATALFTGLSSFIYEIVWIRMLSFVFGASTYSFEIMLASFILGIALGGLWVRRRIDSLEDPVRFLGIVQLVMGIAAVATLAVYAASFDMMAWLLSSVSRNDGGFLIFNLSSTAIALMVMLPATFCAGMTLPLITYRLLRSPTGERAIGMVYSFNTLGSIVGVFVAVHLLLETLGLRWTLAVGAAIDVALGVVLLLARPSPRVTMLRMPWEAIAGIAALVVIAGVFGIDPRRSASGVFRNGVARLPLSEEVVYHHDGKTASVDVLLNPGHNISIRTNGKPDAAIGIGDQPTGDEFTMTLLAMLPLGHRPDARNAAVIGYGSGMSTSLVLASPKIERVDTIEIEPGMVEGAKKFRPLTDASYTDPRSHIIIDDAKSYFARGRAKYDIIVSEPSNPWVSGVSSLFSEEFYSRISGYMNDGAVLSQWLHTYEMDSATFGSILAAVSKTFPDFVLYSSIDSDVVLIARKGGKPGRFDASVLGFPKLQPMLKKLKLTDPEVVRRRAVASWSTLAPFFREYRSPTNSDYFPFVDQRAGKTRFTRARVDDLIELSTAPVPLLEMLDGTYAPATMRHDVIPTTMVDLASNEAWRLREGVNTGTMRDPVSVENARESSARLVASWTRCSSGIGFEQMIAAFTVLAQSTSPFLDRATANGLWSAIDASACARKLQPDDRRWLALYEAVAARDAVAMVANGRPILEATRGKPSESAEYAFLATVEGLLCQGEPQRARIYLEQADKWIRDGQRITEQRYLATFTAPADGVPPNHPACRK